MGTNLMNGKLTLALLGLVLASQPARADKDIDYARSRAQQQLRTGKPKEARKTLEKVASQHATNPEAHVALCLLYQRLGSLDEAMVSAQKAAEVSLSAAPAERAAAHAALASLDLRMGAGAGALAHARQAEQAQATPLALAALARSLVRIGNSAAALETADRAVGADPGAMVAHEARGEALAGLGRGPEAVTAFRQAIELAPDVSCPLCQGEVLELTKVKLSAALVGQGITAEAIILAREATEADPFLGEALAVLAMATVADDPDDSTRWNDAVMQARRGTALEPKNPDVAVTAARVLEAAGKILQSESAYLTALHVDPKHVLARLGLIHVRVLRGDLGRALEGATELVTDAPGNGEAQLALGRVLLLRGQPAEAVAPLTEATKLLAHRAEAHGLLGSALQRKRQFASAAGAYARAAELEPGNVAYPAALGLLLGLAGEPEAAIVELERLIQTPGYRLPTAHVNLGWIYRNMDPPNLEAAVAAYQTALQLAPSSGQAALGLGWTYYHLSRWDEAVGSFQTALEVGPRFVGEANYGIARCYYFKREMAQARSHLAKAKAAGHDVTSLELAIQRYEEALAESAEKARRLLRQQEQRRATAETETRLIKRLQDPGASTEAQARAARGLGRLAGPRAVTALIWALRAENRDLRLAAAQALGEAGPAAKEALPTLRHIVKTIADPKVFATREEVEESIKDADVRRAARDAILKIAREKF